MALEVIKLITEKDIIVCNFEKENQIELPYKNAELLLSNYTENRSISGVYSPYELAVFKIE